MGVEVEEEVEDVVVEEEVEVEIVGHRAGVHTGQSDSVVGVVVD